MSGKILVEDSCIDQLKNLVIYYKSFWLTKIPVKMWCNNAEKERTNNSCEGFHNGLRQTIQVAHPNLHVLIELLRKFERGTCERFERCLRGEDVLRFSKRRIALEHKISLALQRHQSLSSAITPRQFFDNVAVAYLEFYTDERITRENGVLELVTRVGGVDTVRRLLNEQDVCGCDSLVDFEHVEINETTETFYSSVIEATTSIENERPEVGIVEVLRERQENAVSASGMEVQVTTSAKRRAETKPKRSRRKRSVLWRLEEARKRARKRISANL